MDFDHTCRDGPFATDGKSTLRDVLERMFSAETGEWLPFSEIHSKVAGGFIRDHISQDELATSLEMMRQSGLLERRAFSAEKGTSAADAYEYRFAKDKTVTSRHRSGSIDAGEHPQQSEISQNKPRNSFSDRRFSIASMGTPNSTSTSFSSPQPSILSISTQFSTQISTPISTPTASSVPIVSPATPKSSAGAGSDSKLLRSRASLFESILSLLNAHPSGLTTTQIFELLPPFLQPDERKSTRVTNPDKKALSAAMSKLFEKKQVKRIQDPVTGTFLYFPGKNFDQSNSDKEEIDLKIEVDASSPPKQSAKSPTVDTLAVTKPPPSKRGNATTTTTPSLSSPSPSITTTASTFKKIASATLQVLKDRKLQKMTVSEIFEIIESHNMFHFEFPKEKQKNLRRTSKAALRLERSGKIKREQTAAVSTAGFTAAAAVGGDSALGHRSTWVYYYDPDSSQNSPGAKEKTRKESEEEISTDSENEKIFACRRKNSKSLKQESSQHESSSQEVANSLSIFVKAAEKIENENENEKMSVEDEKEKTKSEKCESDDGGSDDQYRPRSPRNWGPFTYSNLSFQILIENYPKKLTSKQILKIAQHKKLLKKEVNLSGPLAELHFQGKVEREKLISPSVPGLSGAAASKFLYWCNPEHHHDNDDGQSTSGSEKDEEEELQSPQKRQKN